MSKASDKPQYAQMRLAVHAEIERGRDSKYWTGSTDDSAFMGKFYDQERLLIDMHARFPEIQEAVIAEVIGDRFAWFEMR